MIKKSVGGGEGDGGGAVYVIQILYIFCLAWFSKQCVTFELALNVAAPVVSFTEVAYMWHSDIKTAP